MKNAWLRKLETSWSQKKKKDKDDSTKGFQLDLKGLQLESIETPKWSAESPSVFSHENFKMVPQLAALRIKSNPNIHVARVIQLHEKMECRTNMIGSPGGFVERNYHGTTVNRKAAVKPIPVSYLLSGPTKRYKKPTPKELNHENWNSFFTEDKAISMDIRESSSAHQVRRRVQQHILSGVNSSFSSENQLKPNKSIEESSLFNTPSIFENVSVENDLSVVSAIRMQIGESSISMSEQSLISPTAPMPQHMVTKAESLWMKMVKELRCSALDIVYKDIATVSSLPAPTDHVKKVISYICHLFGLSPSWDSAKKTLFKEIFAVLKFLREMEPLTIPKRRLKKAIKLKETGMLGVTDESLRRSCPEAAKLLRWINAFNAIALLILRAIAKKKERKDRGLAPIDLPVVPTSVLDRGFFENSTDDVLEFFGALIPDDSTINTVALDDVTTDGLMYEEQVSTDSKIGDSRKFDSHAEIVLSNYSNGSDGRADGRADGRGEDSEEGYEGEYTVIYDEDDQVLS